jgi:hypothetical protein
LKDNGLLSLVQSWLSVCGEEGQQLADFDVTRELVKFWVFLGSMRPVGEVLGILGLPACITGHQYMFEYLIPTHLRYVAVDLERRPINLYFRTTQQLTREDVNEYVTISGENPISILLLRKQGSNFRDLEEPLLLQGIL